MPSYRRRTWRSPYCVKEKALRCPFFLYDDVDLVNLKRELQDGLAVTSVSASEEEPSTGRQWGFASASPH